MNSLKVKIVGLITVIVVTIITMSAVFNFQMQKQMHQEVASHHTAILMDTIRNSITEAMRAGHSEKVQATLARIQSQKLIKALRIVDDKGKILNSADKREIGTLVPDDERAEVAGWMAKPLHFSQKEGNYDSYTRIMNEPACHQCHPASQQILGLLEIELSLDYLSDFLAREKTTAIFSTMVIVLLIIVTIYGFLVFYVDRPIQRLVASMQQVEQGDFTSSCHIDNSIEMQTLSSHYSEMVHQLKNVLDTAVSHERELAIAQGKLAHHREIHVMNQKLEEQIREIEQLNITLEERIEEIEEANYKIADLAGDLEDKNTTLEKAVAKLSTLYKVGLGINSIMDLQKLFELIVATTMETLHGQISYIILYDRESDLMRVTTIQGYDDMPVDGAVLEMKSSGVSAWVIRNHKPLLIADINETPQFDRFSTLGYERKTLVCAPLIVKDDVIGTITVVNKNDNSIYNNEELELLTTIAAQASIAIKNAQLYDEQQKTYMNTIHALVSAIEASDSYTRGHSERVTRYSMAMARKLELSPERIKIVERAAILHDIGKIGIDLTLLHKEGKLSTDDVRDLQQHPVIGMKILEPIEFLNDVRICIGQHHERYDGQGYPNNIPSEHLLLESRILAIADAFDAMTSDRPYRKALPVTVAVQELIDNAGTQFDPHLVPSFVELIRSNTFSFQHTETSPQHQSHTPILQQASY
jgi:putative nucleotidyltransferase with HDIG domain